MGLSQDIRRQLINSFKTEQKEHIQKITQGLLALEKNPDDKERQALLEEIFREAHSLKGAARAVGMTTTESLGHALEDLLLSAKEGKLALSAELFDLFYQALDAIEGVTERVEAGQATPSTAVLTLLARLEEAKEAVGSPAEPDRTAASSPTRQPATEPTPAAEEQVSAQVSGSKQEPGRSVSQPTSSGSAGEASEAAEDRVPGQAQSAELKPQIPGSHSDETIRVSVNKLDALMARFSELLGAKIRAEQRLTEIRDLQTFAADWQKEWTNFRSNYNRLIRNSSNDSQNGSDNKASLDGDRETRPESRHPGEVSRRTLLKDVETLLRFATYTQEQLRTFNLNTGLLYRQLANDTLRLTLIIEELQEEIKQTRLLPLSTITTTFGRMVRDLARTQDKQISLIIEGDETELDKYVLEQIKDPLIHLLRNAVDHGLETTSEREQAGKPAEGQIILSASQQGNNIVIKVYDDGRGLDLAAINRSAVSKGFISQAEVGKLSEAETVSLIFSSGLSTSKIITDISGRGVGLDVVRQNIEELHGTLEVAFVAGQGTTFTMTLPLTLISSRGLLVQAGQQVFALPLTTVERLLQIRHDTIGRVDGKEVITYEGKPLMLAWLADLLELPRSSGKAAELTVVIVGVAEKRLGLIVDQLVGEQEIVIKSLGKPLNKVGGIAGATVLGSGQVTLVLHTADLVKLTARLQAHVPVLADSQQPEVGQRKTILVVDDSITTRTLEKNILEAAGYEVKLATNGEEALGILATEGLPNLIVTDVNMPRLDGLGLTSQLKQDKRFADIPVILVTSLASPADKARGIEVGADAYIVKSNFDQGTLLDTIEQLI